MNSPNPFESADPVLPPAPPTEPRSIEALVAPEAREAMRREIESVRGSEVFFVGRLNADLVVEEVEACAWGNRNSVPAISRLARPGDVLIHNHPSGNLEPSNADIEVFSQVGDRGVGAYIVNNSVTQVRVVVKAMRAPGTTPLDVEAMAATLEPGGRLALRLEGYEHRPQQIRMLRAVSRAFNADGIAVVEAGTGTGKSLAYLLPAIGWALRNNEKVVVSTHTINLQEQLVEKDLPLLAQALGREIEVALVKGRSNYLCRRKADYVRANPSFADVGEARTQLDAIQEWIKTTRDGSLSDLGFVPNSEVWDQVVSESDNCLRVQCPFYQNCFFYNSRRRAARAHVLVANHHLLMADLAVRADTENYAQAAVLPAFHRLILDEAHHIEDVATESFGARVSRQAIQYSLRRLASPRTGEGLLRFLSLKIHEGLYPLAPDEAQMWMRRLAIDLMDAQRQTVAEIDEAAERAAMALEEEAGGSLDAAAETKRRLTPDFLNARAWQDEIAPSLKSALASTRKLLEELRELFETLYDTVERETPDTMSPLLDLRSVAVKLDRHMTQLVRFLGGDDESCRWIEYRRRAGGRRPTIVFCTAPLDVAPEIRDTVLRRFRTVVLASATLTVENSFGYFLSRVGATDPRRLLVLGSNAPRPTAPPADPSGGNEPAERSIQTLALDTPFDYRSQVYVGVPTDLPSPKEDAFSFGLSEFLRSALLVSRGRAFVLFTSYALLERVYSQVAPELEEAGYPCLKQGTISRTLLTETFKRDIGSVLFATASFWEGVDVPGEALSCLILSRLPFAAPGDPLMDARIEAIKAAGGDAFSELIVPRAVIKFRQGFGRLIRTRSDRGAVLIADRRVATQNYGRKFLRSLPTDRVDIGPARKVLADLEGFFGA